MLTTSASRLLLGLAVVLPSLGVAQETGSRDAFFDSDGVRLRYVVRGSGPPVLLLHGLTMNIELNWAGLGIIDSLSSRYTVIALDQRGHGGSDKPNNPEAYGIHLVEDVVRLLDHLQISRVHVVGYSLGGLVSLKFLTKYPGRVASAVLGGFGWRSFEQGRPAHVSTRIPQLDRAVRGEITVLDALLGPDQSSLPPPIASAVNRNDPAAMVAVLRGDSTLRDVTERQLRTNAIPVLAIVGENDFARPDVERMVGLMGNLKMTIVPQADHLTTVGHPMFIGNLLRFLGSQH
jgi:pimeloyl-ACP methyl ester carboxylesterase